MTPTPTCKKCGTPLERGLLGGLCPRCLGLTLLGSADSDAAEFPVAGTRLRYVGDYELQEEIARSGTVGAPFQISQTNSASHRPLAAAFDGANYLVVWNRDLNPSSVYTVPDPPPPAWVLDARFVSQSGSFVGNEFTLVNTQAIFPSLVFDGANYLLSAGLNLDLPNDEKNILFGYFDRIGATAGSFFTLFPTLAVTNTPIVGGCELDGARLVLSGIIGAVVNPPSGGVSGINGAAGYATFIPLSFSSPTLAAGNRLGSQFPLTLTGTPGINYALQVSTNVVGGTWTRLVTNSPANGTFTFTDSHATNARAFYRAVKR